MRSMPGRDAPLAARGFDRRLRDRPPGRYGDRGARLAATGVGESDRLQALAEGYPGAEPADADLLELLETFPSARPPLQELIGALGVLQPRLYSIASSLKATPGAVHLDGRYVRFEMRRRRRKGVASTFLAERREPGPRHPGLGPGVARLPAAEARRSGHHDRAGHRRRAVPRLFAGAARDRRHGAQLAVLRAQRRGFDYPLRGRARGLSARRSSRPGSIRRSRATRATSLRPAPHALGEPPSSGRGWKRARISMSVATRSAWRATSIRALAFLVAKHGGMEWAAAKAYLAKLGREGRYQRDVY